MINKIFFYLKGIAIGMTDVIPGISGATTAILLGVYDKIIFSTSSLAKAFSHRNWRLATKHLAMLIPLLLGVATGLILFAKIIKFLLHTWPIETQLAFSGLILGSLPSFIVSSKILPITIKKSIWFILGSLLMISVLLLDASAKSNTHAIIQENNALLPPLTTAYTLKLFFMGLVVSIATALPGISGSLILLILGEYYHVLAILNYWLENLIHGKMSWQALFSLAGFAIGLLIGLLTYATIVSKILDKYRNELFSFALGLILFSILKIWPNHQAISIFQGLIIIPFASLPMLSLLISKKTSS